LRLEYQLTSDEFNEALYASGLPKHKGRAPRNSIWAWIILAIVALFALSAAVYTARDIWVRHQLDPRSIADQLSMPAPWILLSILFSLPRLIPTCGKFVARVALIFWVLVTGLMLAFIVSYQSDHSWWPLPWVSLFIMAVSYSRFFFRSKHSRESWERSTHLHGGCALTAGDECILFEYPQVRIEHEWRSIQSWSETHSTFLLHVFDSSYHIVPKSAFKDSAQMQEFRELLAYATSPKAAAFPVLPVNPTVTTDGQR